MSIVIEEKQKNYDKPGVFKPGHVPIGAGRSKWVKSIRELARGWSTEAMATIKMIMNDEESPRAVRLQAAGMIIDRAWGKAEQSVHVSRSEDRELEYVTTIELKKMFLESIGQSGQELDMIEGEISENK